MGNLRPYFFIVYIVFSIFLFKPIDRFIKEKNNYKDFFAPIRWLLIFFALSMGLVFSILITDYTITGNKKHLDDAYLY